MLPKIFVVFLMTIVFQSKAQQPIQWQKSIGGSEYEIPKDIKPTLDGGFIAVGDVSSNNGDVTGNHGGYSDAWVIKLNAAGNLEWQRCMGGSQEEEFRSVAQTFDSGFIMLGFTASFDGDVSGNHGADYWLVKLDKTGATQWQKCLGGGGEDIGYFVQQTADSGYIVTGESSSTDGDVTGNNGNPGTKDVWIVKLNKTGSITWQKNLGSTGNDLSKCIRQTTDGGFILAATAARSDGDVTSTGHGGHDAWILKLDASGFIQWQKCFGGSGSEESFSIFQNSDGSYTLLCATNFGDGDVVGWHAPPNSFPTDYWLVKITSTGTIIWQKCFGGTGQDYPYSMAKTPDGGYVLAGWTSSNDGDVSGNHGFDDYWIVKINAAGNIDWKKCYGGSGYDDCLAVQPTNDGGYVMIGLSDSNNGDVSGNHGLGDYWVVKLGGTVLPVKLISFSGKPELNSVRLNWQTSGENNSASFEIEKSADGTSFGKIGSMSASGNTQSAKTYSFTDNNPFPGFNYYRLKQVDLDGRFAISHVIKIILPKGNELFSVFPNPVSAILNIYYVGSGNQIQMRLYNLTGQLVKKYAAKAQPVISINTSELQKGVYFLDVADEKHVRRQRIVVN